MGLQEGGEARIRREVVGAREQRRIVAQHGGRFIVRGGQTTTLEGPESSQRLVVIEFPSAERARAFYDSPEYTAARKLREGGGDASFVLVEGYPEEAWQEAVAASSALSLPAG